MNPPLLELLGLPFSCDSRQRITDLICSVLPEISKEVSVVLTVHPTPTRQAASSTRSNESSASPSGFPAHGIEPIHVLCWALTTPRSFL
jgi:hypothetical protein